VAKLSRQYLKWFGNATYKYEKNGERWLLETLRDEPIRTVLDIGANVGKWSLIAAEMFPRATIYALEIIPATAAELRTPRSGAEPDQDLRPRPRGPHRYARDALPPLGERPRDAH